MALPGFYLLGTASTWVYRYKLTHGKEEGMEILSVIQYRPLHGGHESFSVSCPDNGRGLCICSRTHNQVRRNMYGLVYLVLVIATR